MGDKLHTALIGSAITLAVLDHELVAILLLVGALLNILAIAWALREDDDAVA